MKRNSRRILILMLTVIVTALLAAFPVSAASKAKKNQAAVALYEKKAGKIVNLEARKYVDITGDGVKEAIFYYHPKNSGSGRKLVIYTYKKGKIKKILSDGNYGLIKLIVYKKSKSFIAYGAGHGNEWYRYFKMKNGKYKEAAMKARTDPAFRKSAWYRTKITNSPYKGSRKELTVAEFNAAVKGIKKGKKKTVKMF